VLFSADRYLAFVPLLTHAHQPVYRLLSLSKASNPFPEITRFRKLCNNCSVSKTNLPRFDPSFIFVRYFTRNQSYRPNCDYDLKYWIIYYHAMLHINTNIMTSQQRWYLLLSCFNNKINFLFSCEIRSWSLRFRQFDICQVNTAQSNTLVHSVVTNKWAKFGAKIFRHFWDIAIFVLRYFILPHPVHVKKK